MWRGLAWAPASSRASCRAAEAAASGRTADRKAWSLPWLLWTMSLRVLW